MTRQSVFLIAALLLLLLVAAPPVAATVDGQHLLNFQQEADAFNAERPEANRLTALNLPPSMATMCCLRELS